MKPTIITKGLNFFLFQVAWFAAIFLHNNLGAIICFAITIISFFFLTNFSTRKAFVNIIISLFGFINDLLITKMNIISTDSFPFWLAAVWLVFVSTFDSSLSWLRQKNVFFIAIIGGIGGALSYYSGARLGAINYQLTSVHMFVFFFANWFFLFPILYILHQRLTLKIA